MRSFLNSRWRTVVLVAACLALVVTFAARLRAAGSISITAVNTPVTENFNTLATATSSVLPNGWALAETGTNANTTYSAGTGSGNAGDTYSFGSLSSFDRAFGTLLSGSLTPTIGASFTNNTGGTITSLAIAYTGEQWRLGTSGRGPDRLDFQYSTNATGLLTGTWVDVDALDFSSPITVGTVGALDGNNSLNRKPISYTVTDLNIPNGATFWIRWSDFNASGSDDGLAVDDFSLTATAVSASTNPSGVAAAAPSTVETGTTTTLTVAATPGTNPTSTGLAVTADLTAIGGSAAQTLFDDGTNGDVIAGDSTFTYLATVAPSTAPGAKTIPFTITDAQSRTGGTTLPLTVTAPPPELAIHDIQGSGPASPYSGQRVGTQGIVTGVKSNGFFIQAADSDADTDPRTSEGVFVYTGAKPTVTAGDSVKVVGTVTEYPTSGPSLTEIGSPSITVLASGVALPSPITLTVHDPDPNGTVDQLERYEGMRVKVESLTVVGPTGATGSGASTKSNGLFYGVVTGVARPFREAGLEPAAAALPGMPQHVPQFDGNPERLLVDSDALGAALLDVTSGAVVTGLVGPLDYYSDSYAIDPETTPTVVGNISAVPVPDAGAGEFTVASWNMLSFKSTDGTRMDKAVLVVRDVLRLPDVIGVEEVSAGTTLQDLADKMNAEVSPSPGYTAHMADLASGSQNVGFLVKSTVTDVNVTEVGRTETFSDPRNGKPMTINDRPPLVLTGKVTDVRGGPSFPLTVIVNHLRSLIDVDTAGGTGDFVRAKRRAGGEFLANLIAQHQASGEHVVSVGDYNAFQFNDGYVDVIGTVLGAPTPADQVLLASPDLVNPNFADLMAAVPTQQYSYVENGNAQILDHIVVSPDMVGRAGRLVYARTSTDFPKIYALEATRPERTSDHDPVVAYFKFPTADLKVTTTPAPLGAVLSGSNVTYTLAVTNDADDDAAGVTVTDTLPEGMTVVSATSTEGWSCASEAGTASTTVTCGPGAIAAHGSATVTIVATLNCLLPTSVLTSNVKLEAYTYDPDLTNNSNEVSTTVSNPAPAITGEEASPATLWPVNHKMVPVAVDYDVADNCGPMPVCTITNIKSSEPTDGKGDGRSATDWRIVDNHKVLLRAERSGTGNGRTYTVTVTCTDVGGNSGTKDVFVTVPKSQGQEKK